MPTAFGTRTAHRKARGKWITTCTCESCSEHPRWKAQTSIRGACTLFANTRTRCPLPNAAGRGLVDPCSKIGVWTQVRLWWSARGALAGTNARHMRTCGCGPPPQRKERRPPPTGAEKVKRGLPARPPHAAGGTHDRKEAMCVRMESCDAHTTARGAWRWPPSRLPSQECADRRPKRCAAAENERICASGMRGKGSGGWGAGGRGVWRTSQNLAPIWLPHWPPWI